MLFRSVLQGSGAAPCIWLSLSCILLQALHFHTTGFQASCPRNNRTSQHPREAFVDDTGLWLTGTYPFTPPSTLVSTMQRVAQVWERLLFASGGALALQKCFYYLVHWKWTPPRVPVPNQCHRQPNKPPPNDLRKVNIFHHHT